MLKPSFRLFIVPLGAICTIATLASQNAPQGVQRTALAPVSEQLVACTHAAGKTADICILSESPTR
jgi:hypothetical protein